MLSEGIKFSCWCNKLVAMQSKKRYATKDEDEKSRLWQELQEVQRQIDEKIEEIYGIE